MRALRPMLAAAAAASLALAAGAGAAPPPAQKWIDKPDGFSVVLPPRWYPVPRTVAAVKATIAAARKAKRADLAAAYGFFLTPAGKRELEAYSFQAFYFNGPTSDPVPIELSIQIVRARRAYTAADLRTAGRTYARALAANKGARISAPKRIELPAGPAQYVVGTVPNGGGVSTGLELYILAHGKRLYVLSFKIDARVLAQAKVFRSIAEHFAWT
ncbi:MAG TPA: hypothetical protein VFB42_13190 [Gaiellaceae bacterium]|nr:hypothetical protein [Gaiellaceae bacterium]